MDIYNDDTHHVRSLAGYDILTIDLAGTTIWSPLTVVGKATLSASTTARASLNIPAGTAPTSPTNGDEWYDGTHRYSRVNGTSVPLDAPPVGSITGLGTGVATFLATPTSANFAAAITNETGTGSVVLSDSPVFSTLIRLGAGAAGVAKDGAGSNFTPQFQNTPTSGVAGVMCYVVDGTNNRRIAMFADQTNAIVGHSYTYSSVAPRYVMRSPTGEVFGIDTNDNFGLGTGATVSAKLHVIKTAEQFRGGYDASNWFSFTVGSTGLTTITGAGTAAGFSFSKPVQFTDLGSGELLTIASGVVTATGNYHKIDTEASAASDDLDTINWSGGRMILVISNRNNARAVTAKDGTGNLQLAGDFVMDNVLDTLTLFWTGSAWQELARSNNA